MEDPRKIIQNIEDAQWLLQPHVHMSNPERVIEKMNCIARGGKEKLQVIFDFDRTLTKHHDNGVLTKSSFCMLESLPSIPEDFQKNSKSNYDKYLPIEFNPNLSVEEKIPFMMEWWIKGIDNLKGIKWNPEEVDEFISKNQQPFRDGTNECFRKLHSAGVPVLIFSAGVGDIVEPSLRHQGVLMSNVHIVSNFLAIENGEVTGCKGDIIHVFNKNEHLIENTSYFNELTGRSNVILLGDSEGDAKMADGVPHDIVLKIGFLNTNIEESLAQYKNVFDIVLTDDQTMDVLAHILKTTL